MGVHDLEKYPAVKALLEIPEDEPIFILRAQDISARRTLIDYTAIAHTEGASTEFVEALRSVRYDFEAWQKENRDRVKIPD